MMSKIKIRFFAALIAVCISTLLLNLNIIIYANTNEEINQKSIQKSEVKNIKKNELNLTQSDFKTLDTNLAVDESSFNIIQNSFEGLTRFDYKQNKVTSGIARSWKVSYDGLTWTFYLRDAKWSDGKPVTAYDFEYSWKRLLNSDTKASYSFYLINVLPIKNAQEYFDNKVNEDAVGIKAVNDKIFKITLSKPAPYLLSTVSFPILYPLRKDIVEKQGHSYGQDASKLVYNGPYTVTNLQRGKKVVLEKNKNYWDAKNVKLDKINFIMESDKDVKYKMMKNNELDEFDAFSNEFKRELSEDISKGNIRCIKKVEPSIFMIYINEKNNPILNNVKIKRALSLAIDREAYVKDVLRNGIAAYGLIPPSIVCGDKVYREEVPEQLKKNNENPRKLFIEGLKELGIDEDPSKVTLHYLTENSTPLEKAELEFFKNQWEKNIGCNIVVDKAQDFVDFIEKQDEGKFEMALLGWGSRL